MKARSWEEQKTLIPDYIKNIFETDEDKKEWEMMSDLQRAEEYIWKRIEFINNTPITDGVHNVLINEQLRTLLLEIIEDIRSIAYWHKDKED